MKGGVDHISNEKGGLGHKGGPFIPILHEKGGLTCFLPGGTKLYQKMLKRAKIRSIPKIFSTMVKTLFKKVQNQAILEKFE